MDDALAFAPIAELSTLIRRGELSPLELTELYLERIERYDLALNAYLAVTAERARAQARAAEAQIAAGTYLGPLHGIPLAFKDLVDVAGLPTTGGSTLLRDNIAAADATIARRLFATGAVLLGKTHLVEFAFGGTGVNHHYGTPVNPWGIPKFTACRAGRLLARAWPWRLDWPRPLSARTLAAQCGFPRPFAASPASSPPLACSPTPASCPSTPPSTASGRCAARRKTAPCCCKRWRDPALCSLVDHLEGEGRRPCGCASHASSSGTMSMRRSKQRCALRRAFLPTSGSMSMKYRSRVLDELVEWRSGPKHHGPSKPFSITGAISKRISTSSTPLSRRASSTAAISSPRTSSGSLECATSCAAKPAWLSKTSIFSSPPTTPFAAPILDEIDRDDVYFPINGLCLRNTIAVNLLDLCAVSLPCGFTRDGLPIGLQLIGHPHDEGAVVAPRSRL